LGDRKTWYDFAKSLVVIVVVTVQESQENQFNAQDTAVEYQCLRSLDLCDSPALERLATQAIAQRHLRICLLDQNSKQRVADSAIPVQLCEDGYPGWLAPADLINLHVTTQNYQPKPFSRLEIEVRIPGAIALTHQAMRQPNEYLWGGTVGPNFDCSGLMQTAFAAMGVWLPRDAYQQEAFAQAVSEDEVQPGDLVFFGTPQKATHVGLYLGEAGGDRRYIHSSGKDQGNNGIAIDVLSMQSSTVSRTYYAQLRGFGRIMSSYDPRKLRS
jgi:NlpC/P60 family/Bacterial dipeptidyl-peptidase Sh3 domain